MAISRRPKAKAVLIISGINWNSPIQRHHQFAHYFCKRGFDVDFLEGMKTSKIGLQSLRRAWLNRRTSNNSRVNLLPNGLRIVSMKIMPPSRMSKSVNNFLFFLQRTMLRKRYDLIVTFVPVDIVPWVRVYTKGVIWYDCVRAFKIWGGYSSALYENEKELIQAADIFTCDSFFIKEVYADSVVDGSSPNQIIPPFPDFDSIAPLSRKPIRIGYFGSLGEHVDLNLFNILAQRGFELHYWGSDEPPSFVKNHGYFELEETLLNSLVSTVDILLIPYLSNVDGVYPAKLNQALSTGLPVFSSRFYDSVRMSEFLYIYESDTNLINQLGDFDYVEWKNKNKKIKEVVVGNSLEDFEGALTAILNQHKI